MLRIEGLSLQFNHGHVLKGVNFTLKPGLIYGIAGESGAGKSSLLKIIAGILDPTEGKVFSEGRLLPYASQRLIPGHPDFSWVAQDYKLDPFHTCEENIRETILNWKYELREKRVKKMLKILKLSHLSSNQAHVLSGGEQQRLALARALAPKPKLLLLDEPFSNLDALLRLQFIEILKNLNKEEGLTLMLVSHDAQDLLGLCHEMAFLKKGRLSSFINPLRRFNKLNNLKEALLFGPLNVIDFQEKQVRFRPNSYDLVNQGIPLILKECYFNGIVYVHYFYTEKKEKVILYHLTQLEKEIQILPVHENS
jgi:iron(III) transport system ATP-binding protein